MPTRRVLADLASLLLVAGVVLFAAVRYVASERAFPYWDNAMHQDAAILKALTLRDLDYLSPRDVFGVVETTAASTGKRFSDLPALPTAPFILAFGASRRVYIAALALCFTLPLALAIGAVAARLIPSAPRSAFWCGTLVALVTPAVWLPGLRGYPDAGAAALVVFAASVYLQDVLLGRWWQSIVIGLCLAFAILFQHHFLYSVVPVFACMAFVTITAARGATRRQQESVGGEQPANPKVLAVQRLGFLALALLGSLAVVGLPFFLRLLPNAREMYAVTPEGVGDVFAYFAPFYGLIACLAAPIGLIAGWSTRALDRRATAFLLLILGISVLHWVAGVGKLDVPFTLHFTPWIVLGVVAALWTIVSRARPAAAGVAGLALAVAYLLANVATALRSPDPNLNGAAAVASAPPFPGRALFAQHLGPVQRQDHAEVARLTDYLNRVAADRGAIYVAASSRTLNDDLLWHANRTLHEDVLSYRSQLFWENAKLNILHWIPASDDRDGYPLQKLISSKYVVVASPFQGGRPGQQKVVEVVVKAFAEGWPFAKDFERLPETFTVGDGVRVNVYRRLRPTSLASSLQALAAMHDFIGRRPGGQPVWMNMGGSAETYVTPEDTGKHRIDALAGPGVAAVPFVYLESIGGRVRVTGALGSSDPAATLTLRLDALNTEGKVLRGVRFTPKNPLETDFDVNFDTAGASYLLATLSKRGGRQAPDWIGIRGLKVAAP